MEEEFYLYSRLWCWLKTSRDELTERAIDTEISGEFIDLVCNFSDGVICEELLSCYELVHDAAESPDVNS